MTYKAFYTAQRNPALTLEEFPKRWQQHAKLAGNQKELRGFFTSVVQCMRQRDADFPSGASTEFDAINLVGLANLEAGTLIWDMPATRNVMQPDELKTFSRLVVECWVVTQEMVLRSGPPESVVVIRYLKRKPGIDAEAFRNHFTTTHARMETEGALGNLVVRQVFNEVVVAPPPDFQCDAVTELWFADVGSARRYYADTARQATLDADLLRLCDAGKSFAMTAYVSLCQGSITQAA